MRGIKTAKRIADLVKELDLDIDKHMLIINRVTGDEGEDLKRLAGSFGLEVAGIVPQDHNVFQYDLQGKAIVELPEASPAVKTVYDILETRNI